MAMSASLSARYLLTPTMVWRPESIASLRRRRRLLDHALRNAGLNGLGHAAEFLDFFDVLHGLLAARS